VATPAFRIYEFATSRTGDERNESVIKGRFITALADLSNDYCKDKLAVIPAGSVLLMDFAGDFGMYAMADISGVLHRVKLDLSELHHLDWSPYADEIGANPTAIAA
jgi:hypothetical protein